MDAPVLEQIERLLLSLSSEEKLQLLGLLTKQIQQEPSRKPLNLEGSWQGAFPENFDVDSVLKEIRGKWEQELEWMDRIEKGEGDADE